MRPCFKRPDQFLIAGVSRGPGDFVFVSLKLAARDRLWAMSGPERSISACFLEPPAFRYVGSDRFGRIVPENAQARCTLASGESRSSSLRASCVPLPHLSTGPSASRIVQAGASQAEADFVEMPPGRRRRF